MFSKLSKISMSFLLVAAAAPAVSNAADHVGYVGVPVGVAFGSNSYGPRFNVGIDAGYKVTPEIGLGVNWLYGSKTTTVTGATVGSSMSVMPFTVEGNYFLNSLLPGSYAGVNVGFVHSSSTPAGSAVSYSGTGMALGLQAGYDYAIADMFSVGAQVGYEFLGTSGAVPVGTTGSNTNAFNLFATLRVWF